MIRRAHLGDAKLMAELHMQTLQTNLQGRRGSRLLTCHYRNLIAADGAVAFVAASDSGEFAGFVCGIWDSRAVRKRLLITQWLPLMTNGVAYVLRYPTHFLDLVKRFFPAKQSRATAPPIAVDAIFELRPIAVSSGYQGKGIAKALLMQLIHFASDRGFGAIFLITEIDNSRANAFYLKNRFVLVGDFEGYNYYKIAF